jgi:hypothetical protein
MPKCRHYDVAYNVGIFKANCRNFDTEKMHSENISILTKNM